MRSYGEAEVVANRIRDQETLNTFASTAASS